MAQVELGTYPPSGFGNASSSEADVFGAQQPSVLGSSAGGDLEIQPILGQGVSSSSKLPPAPATLRRPPRSGRKQEGLTKRQRKTALLLVIMAGFDILISGSVFCIAFAHAYLDNGVSLYCIGIQALSHGLSSVLLVLRFTGEYRNPGGANTELEQTLLRRRRRTTLVREKWLNIVMGLVMLISSAALLFKAFRKIRFWDSWYRDHIGMDQDAVFAMRFLAWYGFVVYSFQALARGMVGKELQMAVIWHSFIASVVSLLFLLVLAAAVTFETERTWKFEPIAAIVLCVATVAEGTRVIVNHYENVDKRIERDSRA